MFGGRGGARELVVVIIIAVVVWSSSRARESLPWCFIMCRGVERNPLSTGSDVRRRRQRQQCSSRRPVQWVRVEHQLYSGKIDVAITGRRPFLFLLFTSSLKASSLPPPPPTTTTTTAATVVFGKGCVLTQINAMPPIIVL